MKTLMSFLAVLFLASPSHAFFGLLGRDQCNYQQTAYPTYQNDTQHAVTVQVQGLEAQRRQMEARMAQLSSEGLRLQAGIRGYIHTPWSETMLAHMDNSLDCCAPTSVYAILNINYEERRRPAGQDLPQPEYNETTTPISPVEEYPAPPAYVPPKAPTNSCQGYPAQYCSNNWGTPYSEPKPGGGLCLQTGFAATPAWYQAACRNGGKIDSQVCSNPQIAKYPAQYQQCIQMLSAYQNLSVQKRQLGAHIQEMNTSINNVRYSATGTPNYTPSGETKNSFLSGIGNLLGNVITTLGPFMLNQYMSYQQQKSTTYAPGSRMAKYGPPRPVTNVDGSTTMPGSYPRPYYQHPQPPPPYYGPRYGYPFSYGGNYGALLPGYQQGGFGCTPGSNNNGMSLVGSLLGGLGLNLNATTNLQSSFGPNGGYTPYQAYLNAYGNQYAGVPPYSFPGYTPPYQPGSIYGTTPTYRPPYATPYGYQTVPNYYSRFNVNYQPPSTLPPYNPPYSYSPTTYANTQPPTNTFGWQYNSYYYAQQMNNQRMLLENEARMRQRQMDVQFQIQQLQRVNSSYQYQPYQNTSYLSTGYSTPYTTYNPGSYNQVDMKSLLQGLLTGQSAYFNLNVQGY